MAKSSKKSKDAGLTGPEPAAAESEIQTGNGAAKPEKQSVAKSAAGKAAGKSGRPAAVKSRTLRKPRAPKSGNSKPAKSTFSDDDIRMRAYFISERRQQQGLPGDSAHDWLEALRQLQEEAGVRA